MLFVYLLFINPPHIGSLSYRYELTASVLKMRFSIVAVILFTASVTAQVDLIDSIIGQLTSAAGAAPTRPTSTAQGGILSSLAGQLTSAAVTASARPTSAIPSLAAGLSSIVAGTGIASFSSAAVTSSSTRPTSPATSTAPPLDGSDPGLSKGALAGIGVGVGLFGILVILAIFFLLRRRKRNHQQHIAHPDVPEVSGESSGHKYYMGGEWRAEAEVKEHPVEIDSRNVHKNVHVVPGQPVELEAPR
jgi:hypothetical protein